MLQSGCSINPSGSGFLRSDGFLHVESDIDKDERVALRNIALGIRVWPICTSPTFVCLGSASGVLETTLRCGCPEASIVSFSKRHGFLGQNHFIGMASVSAKTAHNFLHTGIHLIVGSEDLADPIGLGTMAALVGSLLPGGYVIFIVNGAQHVAVLQFLQESRQLVEEAPIGKLRIFRRPGGPAELTPFVSFVTRTCNRPRQLAHNIASIKAQTDQNYEHLVLVDDAGEGLHRANQLLGEEKERVRGTYVMVLDDDDILISTGVVSEAKHIWTFKGKPEVIVFKVWRLTEVVPTASGWRLEEYDESRKSHRVCNCYLVRKDLYMKTIDAFGVPVAGDQSWQRALFGQAKSFFWWDAIVSANTRIGRCEQEEEGTVWQLS